MLSPKYFLYLAVGDGKESRLGITSHPRIDAYFLEEAGFEELWVIHPPQPIWLAETVWKNISKGPIPKRLSEFEKLSAGYFHSYLTAIKFKAERFKVSELKPSYLDLPDIGPIFQGRSILGTEVVALLKESGFDLPWDPEEYLEGLVIQSKIGREAAVTRDVLGFPHCRRCGSTDGIYEEYCYFCGSPNCLICSNCKQMGIARSCTPLYFEPFPATLGNKADEIHPVLHFDLTPPQKRAADMVKDFCESPASRFLVWAVCGSGKTEVSFEAVAKVLSNGGNVLYAIPRKDIVIELLPRFTEAFPNVPIVALYGGCPTRDIGDETRLVIATTHQCLRFYHRFDLAVLDEADAFPYQGSAMLHYAVERGLRPDGKLLIMSATPSRDLIQQAKSGKLPYVSIPARHHRQPLVLPEYVIIKNLKMPADNQATLPKTVLELLKSRIEAHRKVLVFMPTLQLIEIFGRSLADWGEANGYRGDWTHSRRDNRLEVKHALLSGHLDFLVTSTIYERGITIRDLDVMVLFADYEHIYDSRTLIQIAGRVGRYGEPAKVYFAARTVTRAMKECSAILREMNAEAARLGYLTVNSFT